jgi:uncharacterized membrane protein
VLLHLSITLTLAALLNIWQDEAGTLYITGKDIFYALDRALGYELQPPLYFVLLNIWRSLNGSIFFAKLFSILCIVLTIYIAERISRRFVQGISPVWIIAIVALNPFLVWAALEIRSSALAILLSAILLLLFFDGFLDEKPDPGARRFYCLVAVLCFYTQYYSLFIFVSHTLTLLLLRRWRALRDYVLMMTAVSVLFIPLLLLLVGKVSGNSYALANRNLPEVLNFIFARFQQFTFPSQWLPQSLRRFVGVVFFSLLILIAIKGRRLITFRHTIVWLLTVTLALSFIPVLYLTGFLITRYFVALFLPVILSIFALLSLSKPTSKKRNLLAFTLVFLCLSGITLYTEYKSLAKDGDYIRVASYLRSSEKSNQPILAFNPEVAFTLKFYYSGLNSIVAIPKAEDFQSYDLRDFVLKDQQQILTALSTISGKHTSLWLVQGDFCGGVNIDYNCHILAKFIDENYSVESTQAFHGATVKLLRRKSS